MILTSIWFWLALAVLAVVVFFSLLHGRPVARQPAQLTYRRARDPARDLFRSDAEPPTEDAIAQARLGGTRGARNLGSAPMVPQQGENTPRHIDDGHVA